MSIWISLTTAALLVAAGPAATARAAASVERPGLSVMDDGRGTPYVVNKTDNICGLDEPRQITSPAKVDYDALLEATPEVQRIRKDGIDPNSSRGITLMTKARSRVLKACESVRTNTGHDSVWKAISRRDKKDVPDITDKVKAALASAGGSETSAARGAARSSEFS